MQHEKPKLNHWSMELTDYNLKFTHIKGSNDILTDAIFRLKTLDKYRDPLEHPKHPSQQNALQRWLQLTYKL